MRSLSRVRALIAVAGLLSCDDPLVCPESWGEAAAIPGQDACVPPPAVVEAAKANLTTGVYGYIIEDRSDACDGSETEVAQGVYFTLERRHADGAFDKFNIGTGREGTFEVELPPGEYTCSTASLSGTEGVLPREDGYYDQRFVLAEGEVLFLRASLGCAFGS